MKAEYNIYELASHGVSGVLVSNFQSIQGVTPTLISRLTNRQNFKL